MTDVVVAITRVSASTSSGTQNITTTDLGGRTPKAVRITGTYATANNTVTSDACISIGVSDGTSDYCLTFNEEDAQGSTDTERGVWDDSLVRYLIPGDATNWGTATNNGFITNGVQLNWSTGANAAYLLTVEFFAGDDLSAFVDSTRLSTVDVPVNYTGAPFAFDAGFFYGFMGGTGVTGRSQIQMGICDGSGNQRSFAYVSFNGLGTSSLVGYLSSDRAFCAINAGGVFDYGVLLSDIDSQGFTHTTDTNSSSNLFFFLLLNTNGLNVLVSEDTIPTTTGSHGVSGLGFTPQYIYDIETAFTSYDSLLTDDPVGELAFSAFTEDSAYSNTRSSRDGVSTSVAKSLSKATASALLKYDGSGLDVEAAWTSMDSGGFTRNFTTVNGSASKWPFLAIQSPGVPVVIELGVGDLTLTGLQPTTLAETEISLGAGALTLAGIQPIILVETGISLGVGALTLAGLQPTTLAETGISLGVGALTLTGYAPQTQTEVEAIQLGVGDLTLTGLAPAIYIGKSADTPRWTRLPDRII